MLITGHSRLFAQINPNDPPFHLVVRLQLIPLKSVILQVWCLLGLQNWSCATLNQYFYFNLDFVSEIFSNFDPNRRQRMMYSKFTGLELTINSQYR